MQTIEVQVQSGAVRMARLNHQILVVNGQTGVYDLTKKTLALSRSLDVNSFSYATRSFLFNDFPFLEICKYLEKSFGIRIEVDRKKFETCRLTAQFDNQPLEYIMDVITATVNATYKVSNSVVSINGEGCNQ
jgi:hypothetical protein